MHDLLERPGVDPHTREVLRGRLSADRRAVTTVIESVNAARATGETLIDREQAALLNHARRHLDQVNAALAKIADEVYGSCELCGTDLPLARLEAMPFAAHCVRCQPVVGP